MLRSTELTHLIEGLWARRFLLWFTLFLAPDPVATTARRLGALQMDLGRAFYSELQAVDGCGPASAPSLLAVGLSCTFSCAQGSAVGDQ